MELDGESLNKNLASYTSMHKGNASCLESEAQNPKKLDFGTIKLTNELSLKSLYIQAEAHYYKYTARLITTSHLLKTGKLNFQVFTSKAVFLNLELEMGSNDDKKEHLVGRIPKSDSFACDVGYFEVFYKEDFQMGNLYCQGSTLVNGDVALRVEEYGQTAYTCQYSYQVENQFHRFFDFFSLIWRKLSRLMVMEPKGSLLDQVTAMGAPMSPTKAKNHLVSKTPILSQF